MRIEPFYDRTALVDQTLTTVHHSLLEGFFFILGVVWLFLRNDMWPRMQAEMACSELDL